MIFPSEHFRLTDTEKNCASTYRMCKLLLSSYKLTPYESAVQFTSVANLFFIVPLKLNR